MKLLPSLPPPVLALLVSSAASVASIPLVAPLRGAAVFAMDVSAGLRAQFNRRISPEFKYFQEPAGNNALSHYDIRFFRDLLPYEDHRTELVKITRAWLAFARDLELETWLAHGTLMGWWWNGRLMPWDTDVDVQISGPSAHRLAVGYNQTLHDVVVGVDNATGAEIVRTYLVDVNPFYLQLSRDQGANVIDARWIDISNGMYIDITVLLERSPSLNPGVWSCKNFHRYLTRDLFPLRETEFEGMPALVPHRVEKALQAEYGDDSLTKMDYNDHHFDTSVKDWVKVKEDA